MDIALLLASWLHLLGLVIVIGYYGVLGRIIIPALERSLQGEGLDRAILSVERRALPLVLLSVVLLAVTGTYLLLVDPHYAGLGNIFASSWTLLMLLKHGVVIVMVGLGVAVDFFVRDLGYEMDDRERSTAIRRVRLSAEAATALGAVAILLTAAAQLSA